ncbi:hypothetical protein JD844_000531 [Phrynosoma platyrhinos]|uniref:IRF tryptophan pentad repeat domain-containing protein n=1 Tax=Phrynosoma platyrhinos TaxID=52577 RepID=A0ABQ7SQQ8_PHRPL|nr:hypothetical protein JD844_000531 [Phrynosoma platyrhinos]
MNKSPDFEEVTDRSQLDISEPYKVYRIVPEEEQKCKMGMGNGCSLGEITDIECNASAMDDLIKETPQQPTSVEEYLGTIKRSPSPPQENCRNQPIPDWWTHQSSPALSLMSGFVGYEPIHAGKLVGSTTTTRPEGCRISLGESPYPLENFEHVRFPSADVIPNDRQRQITKKLFGHLERGVLLQCNKQGIFIKRLSQGRVFWSGNNMPYKDKPNKLDRDEVVKIFDTNYFLRELHQYYNNQGRFPNSKVILCFGEEFPDATPLRFKLILVEIEQLSIRQLVEEAEKIESSAVGHPMAEDDVHFDPMFRNFQDSCLTPQRAIFREHQQITV